MNATTVAVGLAKSACQRAVAGVHWWIVETHRLSSPVRALVCDACLTADNQPNKRATPIPCYNEMNRPPWPIRYQISLTVTT